MKHFKTKSYSILLIACCLLLIASCSSKQTEESKETKTGQPEIKIPANIVTLTDAQIKNAGIQTGRLEKKAISSVLKVSGKIDVPPQNLISVSVPLGGYLKSTKLLAGMHVSKGEVIAVMEDQQYIQLQQDYLTAKAQYAFSESEYNRQKELNQSKATSDKVFEQTKATYQTQAAILKSLEQKLRLIGKNPASFSAGNISKSISIYSPINGFVSAVNVNIGKYVNPSDVLFELVNPADIHLRLNVFEKDLNKISIGQKLYAYTNAQPDKKYLCTIILISKNLSEDRSAQVHGHFEEYDNTLLPGMFMNADIDVKSESVNVLPDEAIVRYENKNFVFIDKGSHQFEMKEVQTGNSENGYTEIKTDNQFANSIFVTKGAYNLLMAMKNKAEEE